MSESSEEIKKRHEANSGEAAASAETRKKNKEIAEQHKDAAILAAKEGGEADPAKLKAIGSKAYAAAMVAANSSAARLRGQNY